MVDKIDQLKIGNTSYDIDLPPDAAINVISVAAGNTVTAPQFVANNSTMRNTYFYTADGGIKIPLRLSPGTNIGFKVDTSAKKIYINKTDTHT